MADFQATLIDIYDEVDIEPNSDCSTISGTDNSNYDDETEDGHARSDFSDYRKIIVTNPDNTTHTFSSLGDGDDDLATPSESSDSFTYTPSTDDGIYAFKLVTVPTYNNTATYSANDDYVYYGSTGKIYKCILASTGNLPTDTTYWTEVTESALSSKYVQTERISVECAAVTCRQERNKDAFLIIKDMNCSREELFNNSKFRSATMLNILLFELEDAVCNSDFDLATDIHSLIAQECDCEC